MSFVIKKTNVHMVVLLERCLPLLIKENTVSILTIPKYVILKR